jgi:hypothetical protein
MIHEPTVIAWGNAHDLSEALCLLKACKESILNVYSRKCKSLRSVISEMMAAATWLDANQALEYGFIDGITEETMPAGPANSARSRVIDRKDAEAKVNDWLERRKAGKHKALCQEKSNTRPTDDVEDAVGALSAITGHDNDPGESAQLEPTQSEPTQPDPSQHESSKPDTTQPDPTENTRPDPIQSNPPGTPIVQLEHRLSLIKPTR